jgi:hypothetical protein
MLGFGVARGRLRGDLQHTNPWPEHQFAVQFSAHADTGGQQLRRRRAHLQPGGRSERGVELLPGCGLEDHFEFYRAGGQGGRGPLGPHPRFVDGTR